MRLFWAIALSGLASAAPVPFTATAGSTASFDFNGFSDDGEVIPGLSTRVTFSDFIFTRALFSRTRVTFRLDIENTSDDPVTASRVSALGFRTAEDFVRSGSVAVGTFNRISTGTMPAGVGAVDFCLTTSTCAGGSRGGVPMDRTGTVYASLLFAGAGRTSITFDDIFVRYQSLTGSTDFTSAVGAPVPEPGAYFVLLSGASLIAWRVRKNGRRSAKSRS